MVINNIISGICTKIYETFGVEYEIYKEDVKQGLNEPCFFVSLIKPTQSLFLGKRYLKTNQFCVQFFPTPGTDARNASYDVGEKLFNALEYIQVSGELCRGDEMSVSINDGILSFFVNYDMFVHKGAKETDLMADVVSDINVEES